MRISLLIFILFFSGCVVIGPPVDNKELKKITKDLKRKALLYQIQQDERVNSIGFRILKSFKKSCRKRLKPYLGLLLADINKDIKDVLNLSQDKGVVVYGTVEGSPAQIAGIKQKDIITAFNSKKVNSVYDYNYCLRRLKPGKSAKIAVERNNQNLLIEVNPCFIPYDIKFFTSTNSQINAFASPAGVVVNYGLLDFIKNDDELAVVLSHEIAHIIRGHLLKKSGIDLLASLAGTFIVSNVKNFSPQAVKDLSYGVSAGLSRNFEREADYFGVIYAYRAGFDVKKGIDVWERFSIRLPQSLNKSFFADHPISSERLLRIKQEIESLKDLDLSDCLYN